MSFINKTAYTDCCKTRLRCHTHPLKITLHIQNIVPYRDHFNENISFLCYIVPEQEHNMQRQIQNTTDIGQTIQTYRKKQGLTQEDLALLANVGRRFVIELEQGKQTAQIGKILQVLHALGIGLNLVITWDTDSEQ